jgi:hypothetical protein
MKAFVHEDGLSGRGTTEIAGEKHGCVADFALVGVAAEGRSLGVCLSKAGEARNTTRRQGGHGTGGYSVHTHTLRAEIGS